MQNTLQTTFKWLAIAAFASLLSACGYNDFQSKDETVKASWAEVLNQYQRRADLIPNLVQTVQGYAKHEEGTFAAVAQARSSTAQLKLTADDLADPVKMKQFQEAQGQMTSALSRLMAVSENYPQLKADQNFRDLQSQLEGTENRITVARNRFVEVVKDYNILVRSVPTNFTAMVMGYKAKESFAVENEKAISTAPKVDFGGQK
ncbi:MAG: LemA family protein [Glaciimonas sp.]|nr:LemA family protein [Glaciimonas sp.]